MIHENGEQETAAATSPHRCRQIAAIAAVHPETVVRYLTGKAVRSTCRARIEAALVELRQLGPDREATRTT